MNGWIKISREIVNHWLWQDAERLRWWLDLLFLAAWDEKKQLMGKQLVILQRGQLIASLSFLCNRWGRSRTMVESFLNLLENEGMITRAMSHNISVISIVNYKKYQAKEDANLDTYLERGSNERVSNGCNSDNQRGSAYLEAHPEAYPDAHLKGNFSANGDAHLDADLNECKSNSSDDAAPNLNAHLDADLNAHPDAINKEYKEYKNNNIASINRSISETSSDDAKVAVDVNKFIVFFNSEMDKADALIPRVRSISGQRLSMLKARCREYGKEAVCDAIIKAAQSNFLNGGGSRGFKADFTWIFRPNNFPRILEGFYDNNSNQRSNGNNKQDDQDKRRGFEVAATSAEDYKTTF